MGIRIKRIYQYIDGMMWSRAGKDRLFLVCNMILAAMAGMVVWFFAGRWICPGIEWFLCFAGYAAFFAGFIGGLLFLYRQER